MAEVRHFRNDPEIKFILSDSFFKAAAAQEVREERESKGIPSSFLYCLMGNSTIEKALTRSSILDS